ncbi:MAG: DNA polymerase III subunit gamma/tau [bacterium]|nr:DNA polymerase III subunit gamma/tau [bacterium]
MSYTVLARRWRPRVFEEVVSQSHVTTTLANALRQERIGQAYLFTGPRGTGKTSIARILAKAVNCEKGPTPKPCLNCPACAGISAGQWLDVIEIDGASNRGIDEIRDLREKVRLSPAKSRYKIYIIDEVHMLTKEAFNALLKTLEEPPPHVIFIFATTEPHKVPQTILSRCQRFDFRRIGSGQITAQLKQMAASEEIEVEEEALALIARQAAGSLRDAQTILDQVISYQDEGSIKTEDVTTVLGLVNFDILSKFAAVASQSDAAAGLRLVAEVVEGGVDVNQLVRDLMGYFRDGLILKTDPGQGAKLIDLPDSELASLREQITLLSSDEILKVIELLKECNEKMKWSSQARLLFELTVIKMSRVTQEKIALMEILNRLEELESRITFPNENRIPDQGIKIATPSMAYEFSREAGASSEIPRTHEVGAQSAIPGDVLISDSSEVATVWSRLIDRVKQKKPSLGSCLSAGKMVELKGNDLVIGFSEENSFQAKTVDRKDYREVIESVARQILDRDINLKIISINGNSRRTSTVDSPSNKSDNQFQNFHHITEMEPIVGRALEIFEGEIIKAVKS